MIAAVGGCVRGRRGGHRDVRPVALVWLIEGAGAVEGDASGRGVARGRRTWRRRLRHVAFGSGRH